MNYNSYLMKGVDVSHWQGNIDFNRVKANGYDFVIIKAGGADSSKMYKDSCFERYYRDAKAAGLYVGAYYFNSYNFTGAAQGRKEAEHFHSLIKGKTFEMPVYCDIEVGTKAGNTEAAIAFCEYMESQGFYCGIYGSDISTFKNRLQMSRVKQFDKWVARYNSTGPKYVKEFGLWQFGGSVNYINSVKVPGVNSSACDQNYCYRNYPEIMKKAGLNGFDKKEEKPVYLYTIIPSEVSEGDYKQITSLLDNLHIPYKTTKRQIN